MIRNDTDLNIIKTEENQKYDNSILKNNTDSYESSKDNKQDEKEYKEEDDGKDKSLESVGFLSEDLTKK